MRNLYNEDVVRVFFEGKEFEIPMEAAIDCSAQGSNDDAVEYWAKRVPLNYWTDEEKRRGLKEVGAWTEEELTVMHPYELDELILWTCSHDAKQNGDLDLC